MPHPATWETLDWPALDAMREGFLAGGARPDYWTSPGAVASFDFTHAQRIAWKWNAVLAELEARGWTPPCTWLLDWGCGSGAAGRCVLGWAGAGRFNRAAFHDRSPLALDFALGRAKALFPGAQVEAASRELLAQPAPGMLLVLSHVLNELEPAARDDLLALARRADAVLWVEPGTRADSRALCEVRDELRDAFTLIAPCPHQSPCGILAEGNERQWCHHHGEPPRGVKGDPDWIRFAKRAGIDLRSLPYSFLAMERTALRAAPPTVPPGIARFLAGARFYKGFAKLVVCREEGVREIELQKRDGRELFKALRDGEAPPLWRLDVVGNRIKSYEPFPISCDAQAGVTPPPGDSPGESPEAIAP
jgi:hypothetical protein